jgi:hypothetical protein
MEVLNIESDLIEENKNGFGNMFVFNNGKNVLNRKAIGLYITILIIILTNIVACYLM